MFKRSRNDLKRLLVFLLLMSGCFAFPSPTQAGGMKAVAFDPPGGAIAVAAIYETSYPAQKPLIKSLKISSKLMKKAAGFKGAFTLRSQDGKQVIAFSQWQDLASYQAFTPTVKVSVTPAAPATAPPAPTRTLVYDVAALQTAIEGATPALRGKEAVVQWMQVTPKAAKGQTQTLHLLEALIPEVLQTQPIPQSMVLLQGVEDDEVALLTNWNCSALFEDVGKPVAIVPSKDLTAIADIDQRLYNVITLIPVEVQDENSQAQ